MENNSDNALLPSDRAVLLFSQDPVSWTAAERAEIITLLRQERQRFLSKKPKKTEKKIDLDGIF